ncbi:MAG: DUF1329 domain-containing protein [Candidatus Binataceae bacterium]
MRIVEGIFCGLLLLITPAIAEAQTSAEPVTTSAAAPAAAMPSIPVGTVITTHNWRQYKDFMPDGMVKLFAGEYALKMPDDAQIVVGPTVIHPLPKGYLDATEKYAAQVKLIELPDGGLTLSGYQGGIPFPNPADPHKGWKMLANLWYRYLPYLNVDTHGAGCVVGSGGSGINCKYVNIVDRQLAYLTDPGVPANTPGAEGKFFSQWLMVTEPEQSRYTATLTISYDDLTREEDSYIFLPALRRYQPISTRARCSPNQGTDSTQEEYRNGFDSNLTELKVDFLGAKKIVMLLPDQMPAGQFPDDFAMPLGWPKPSWGKWQVRDVNVISASKLPAHARGYCYGKRVMYVDQLTAAPLWEDLYDKDMHLWRIYGLFLHPAEVPHVGVVDTAGPMVYAFWDVQNSHTTFFIDPSEGKPFYINEQAPKDYFDLGRYTEPSGLNLIMR